MSSPLLSALILNYRSPKDTVRCVESLRKQTIADRMEIFVVDNHSQDESIGTFRARWKGMPDVRLIENRGNEGYGRGNNLASRYAAGEYILIINPDNVLPRDGAEKLIGELESHPGAVIAGPALLYPNQAVRPSARQFPTIGDLFAKRLDPKRWHENYDREFVGKTKQTREVDWLVGACLLMRREFFQSMGGFDERFFLFFEDIDLCRRCKQAGKKVLYVPGVRVLDRQRRLSGHGALALLTNKTTRIHVASALKYFWKWRGIGQNEKTMLNG